MTWHWNKDYNDKEQVRCFLDQYSELREQGLSYNDSFKGKISGLEDSPNEDTAIYLLSSLWHIEREATQVETARANGYQPAQGKGCQRFAKVLVYRPDYFSGGTGYISEYEQARVIFHDITGQPLEVKPMRKQIGFSVRGAEVLVTQGS